MRGEIKSRGIGMSVGGDSKAVWTAECAKDEVQFLRRAWRMDVVVFVSLAV